MVGLEQIMGVIVSRELIFELPGSPDQLSGVSRVAMVDLCDPCWLEFFFLVEFATTWYAYLLKAYLNYTFLLKAYAPRAQLVCKFG
jgi:hypothetical protein